MSAAQVKIADVKKPQVDPFTTDLQVTVDAWASTGFSYHCSTPDTLKPKDTKGTYAKLKVKVRHRIELEGRPAAGVCSLYTTLPP